MQKVGPRSKLRFPALYLQQLAIPHVKHGLGVLGAVHPAQTCGYRLGLRAGTFCRARPCPRSSTLPRPISCRRAWTWSRSGVGCATPMSRLLSPLPKWTWSLSHAVSVAHSTTAITCTDLPVAMRRLVSPVQHRSQVIERPLHGSAQRDETRRVDVPALFRRPQPLDRNQANSVRILPRRACLPIAREYSSVCRLRRRRTSRG